MHINEHPCWFLSTSVVCSASVLSTLISSDVNDSQSLSFRDLTSFHILPKDIQRRSPCSHIALLCHISTFLHFYVLYLFHSNWNCTGWTGKRSFSVMRNKSTSKLHLGKHNSHGKKQPFPTYLSQIEKCCLCSWHCQLADMPDICKQMFLQVIFSLSMFLFHLNQHLLHS